MNLISKVCVLFLAWMAIGFVATVVEYGKILYKVYKLDPHNQDLADEFFEEALNSVPKYRGTRIKGVSYKKLKEDFGSKTGSNTYTRIFELLIDWPRAISLVVPVFEAAYTRIKDEYDTGIRVRKERLS